MHSLCPRAQCPSLSLQAFSCQNQHILNSVEMVREGIIMAHSILFLWKSTELLLLLRKVVE